MAGQKKAPPKPGPGRGEGQAKNAQGGAADCYTLAHPASAVNPQDLLPGMASYPQWIVWRKGPVNKQGKFDKIPISPRTGKAISGTHDSGVYLQRAGTFQEALDAQKRLKASGLGFVLSKNDPFVGVDIDNCLGNGGDPGAVVEIVEQFDSYTEVTPSGKGLRIFCKGKLPEGAKTNPEGNEYEIYDCKKFLTITGQPWGEKRPLREAQKAIQWYCENKTGIREPKKEPQEKPDKSLSEVAKDLERAKEALQSVPADNYDLWLRIGFALHSTGAGRWAYQVWDEWSRTSDKYDERDQEKTWQSFKGREGGITLGTLFETAKEHGWSSGKETQLSILCLAEIAEEQHPENPLIDGLLDELESLIICGQSGIGKSLLALFLSASLGDPPLNGIWGKFQIPNPVNTLVVQSENSRKATSKRLRAMIKNNPTLQRGFERVFIPEVRNDVRYVGEFREKKFQNDMAALIEATQAGCLILDPLISYHGGDENDNSEMRRSLDALTELQDRTGVATILFHHLGKAANSNEFNKIFSGRGASAIGDWAANILTLGIIKKEGPEAIIGCTHHKARNFPTVPPFYLRRTDDLQFHLSDKPGGEKEQSEVIAVVQALKSMAGQQAESQAQLCSAISAATDWSDKKAQRAIQKAVNTGRVAKTQHPTHKKRQCYTLTSEGQLFGHQVDPDNDPTQVGTVGTK